MCFGSFLVVWAFFFNSHCEALLLSVFEFKLMLRDSFGEWC